MAGSRSLGTLTVDLVAKIAGFEQGMDKAERSLDKRAKRMNDIAKKIGVGIGAAITAGIAAAAGLSILTKQAIDSADAMRDLSIRVGESTELLSVYGYAATQTGTDIDTLAKGLKVLAKNAADGLNPTNEYAKVFDALGITLTDNEGRLRKLGELIPEIADRFKLMEDGTTKAALAQSLFGRAGLDLTEFLNQGSDGIAEFTQKAHDLGIVIDGETAAAADDFNDILGDLKTLVSGFGLTVAKDMLPTLVGAASRLRDLAKDGDLARNTVTLLSGAVNVGVGIMEGYTKAVNRLAIMFEFAANAGDGLKEIQRNLGVGGLFDEGSVAEGIEKVRQAASEGDAALAELEKPRTVNIGIAFAGEGPDPAGLFRMSESEVALKAEIAEMERRIAEALSNPTIPTGGGRSKQLSEEDKEAKRLLETYARLSASFDERIALFGKEGEAAKLRYDLEHGELADLSAAQKSDLLDRAERLDLMNEELDLQRRLDAEDARRSENFQSVMQAIKDETKLTEMSWEQQEIWNNLKWAGVDADSDWGRQIIASTKALQEQREAMEDQIEIMDGARDGARTFFQDLKDGVGVIDSLKDAFGRFADALYDWATDSLIEQFFGRQGATGQGSAGGGWLSALFGSAGSSQGSLIDLFSGAWGFADGGTMAGNSFARVNERGFEMATVGGNDYLLTGNRPVKITPHERLMGGGNITQQFITNGTETRRTREQKAVISGLEAQRALMRTGR